MKNSDKCIHVHDGPRAQGAAITQWSCVNQDNVKWRFVPAGGDYYYIQAKYSGRCMHSHGFGVHDGTPVTQWSCINQANVKWRLLKAPDYSF